MKLLSTFNRANIIVAAMVLLLSGICYYLLIRTVLIRQLDKGLVVEEQEVLDYVKENKQLPEASDYKDEKQFFIPAGRQVERRFSSVEIFDKDRNEKVSYRQLQFFANVAGKGYKVLVIKPQQETEDIITAVLEITLALMLVLLSILFVTNRFLLSKLWKPFHTTLQQINQFNLSGRNKLDLDKTSISEFNDLNNALSIMTSRVSHDYDEIKNFTENASHEIQTPLAIIKSKLELLSQSENLREEQMNTVQSIYEAANRLSKLNQSLVFLTKIDNRQFNEREEVNVSALVNNNISYYEELTGAKNITIEKHIDSDVKVTMNEMLAEILISNLITNAIKHNTDGGSIEIRLNDKAFSILNTGAPLNGDPLQMFERFKKDKVSSESLGLGLSIVKKICERYHFGIRYTYSGLHRIEVDF